MKTATLKQLNEAIVKINNGTFIIGQSVKYDFSLSHAKDYDLPWRLLNSRGNVILYSKTKSEMWNQLYGYIAISLDIMKD